MLWCAASLSGSMYLSGFGLWLALMSYVDPGGRRRVNPDYTTSVCPDLKQWISRAFVGTTHKSVCRAFGVLHRTNIITSRHHVTAELVILHRKTFRARNVFLCLCGVHTAYRGVYGFVYGHLVLSKK